MAILFKITFPINSKMKIQICSGKYGTEWVEAHAVIGYEDNHNGYPVVRLVGNFIRIIDRHEMETNRDAVERISAEVNRALKH